MKTPVRIAFCVRLRLLAAVDYAAEGKLWVGRTSSTLPNDGMRGRDNRQALSFARPPNMSPAKFEKPRAEARLGLPPISSRSRFETRTLVSGRIVAGIDSRTAKEGKNWKSARDGHTQRAGRPCTAGECPSGFRRLWSGDPGKCIMTDPGQEWI